MSAGLAASTVTPGSTAPVTSLTTPARTPVCALAGAGRSASHASATRVIPKDILRVMDPSPHQVDRTEPVLPSTTREVYTLDRGSNARPHARLWPLSALFERPFLASKVPNRTSVGSVFRAIAVLLFVAAVAPGQ